MPPFVTDVVPTCGAHRAITALARA